MIRSAVYDVFQTFDFPDPSVPNGKRPTTTIPTQALMLLNSTIVDRSAEAFAKSLLKREGDDTTRVQAAYRQALGRAATTAEVERVLAYLKKSGDATEAKRLNAWRGFCRVLFASNEYIFVE